MAGQAPSQVRGRMAGQLLGQLRRHSTVLLLLALVAVVTALSSQGSLTIQREATTDLVYLMATVGLYVFVGNSGVFSFGHMAFMAIGAYVGVLLSFPVQQRDLLLPGLPHVLATLYFPPAGACVAAGVVAAVVALAFSVPVMRLSGLAAALTTFAILGIVYTVAGNWQQVTNGQQGIAGSPDTTSLGGALLWALGAIIVAWATQQSRWGRRLRASREDEVAARALGIGVVTERRAAFVLSAFIVGVAGALYGQFLSVLTPDTVYLDTTFLVLLMLIVGGMKSLSGAVIGAIFISVVSNVLERIEQGVTLGSVVVPPRPGLSEVGLSLILLAVLITRPNGITGGREIGFADKSLLAFKVRLFRQLRLSGAADGEDVRSQRSGKPPAPDAAAPDVGTRADTGLSTQRPEM